MPIPMLWAVRKPNLGLELRNSSFRPWPLLTEGRRKQRYHATSFSNKVQSRFVALPNIFHGPKEGILSCHCKVHQWQQDWMHPWTTWDTSQVWPCWKARFGPQPQAWHLLLIPSQWLLWKGNGLITIIFFYFSMRGGCGNTQVMFLSSI